MTLALPIVNIRFIDPPPPGPGPPNNQCSLLSFPYIHVHQALHFSNELVSSVATYSFNWIVHVKKPPKMKISWRSPRPSQHQRQGQITPKFISRQMSNAVRCIQRELGNEGCEGEREKGENGKILLGRMRMGRGKLGETGKTPPLTIFNTPRIILI